MYKNRLQTSPTAPPMSLAHPYTLIDDDDDSDICPVCDGECTCTKAKQTQTPKAPLSMAELSLRYAASTPNSPSSGPACPSPPAPTPSPKVLPPPQKPSLKIKLTVPMGMRKTPTAPTPSNTPSAPRTQQSYPNAAAPRPRPHNYPPTAKKGRGRPQFPAPNAYKPLNPKSAAPGKHPRTAASASKVRQNLKARALSKKVAGRRRRVISSDDESSSSSSLSDVDMPIPNSRRSIYATVGGDAEDDDAFPTFVSASALSSMSSDGSSSSALSTFDSDSCVEQEEESFIKADVSRRRSGGDWVIRPRKKSVGLSDAEMDVDSDATEEEDAEADVEAETADVDADETEEDNGAMRALPLTLPVDEDDSADERSRYTGHATGWSEEDDESSFDADLFFANLSDDGSSSSTSEVEVTPQRRPMKTLPRPATTGDDGDAPLPFEVTEGWDGQLVFTNGSADAAHIVDVEFEADARGFGGDCAADGGCEHEHTHAGRESWREEDSMYDAEEEDAALDIDDEHDTNDIGSDMGDTDAGYIEGSGGEGSGDTTDEELVGADDLPNERAMRLFSLPMSVSAIDPLSTVSSPTVSPGRLRRGNSPGALGPPAPHGGKGKGYVPGWDRDAERARAKERERERRKRMWGGESVRAQDILEGRVLFWDSDEQAHDCDGPVRPGYGRSGSGTEESESDEESGSSGEGRRRRRARTPRGPRQGVFVANGETRQAVIGEAQKGAAVPSPHPRFRGRGRGAKKGRFSAVEHLLRRHLLQSITASSGALSLHSKSNSLDSPALSTAPQSPADTADVCASLDLLFSSAAQVLSGGEDAMAMDVDTQAGAHAPEPIQLDDVLDAAFLDDDSAHDAGPAPEATSEPSGCSAVGRWDLMSVGAFRQTRDAGTWDRASGGVGADFGSALRPAPIGAMLWQQQSSRTGNSSSNSSVKGIKHAKRRQMMLGSAAMSSPLILPSANVSSAGASPSVVARDRDREAQRNQQQQNQEQQQKNRRELRRERKVLKKTLKLHGGAPPAQHAHGHAHHFHAHHHHPNAKLRGAGAAQRSNFFGAVPPLNL